ncbi:MAG: hypothetical protein QXO03_01350 [Thermoplasmatales archaeon]
MDYCEGNTDELLGIMEEIRIGKISRKERNMRNRNVDVMAEAPFNLNHYLS